MRGKDEDVRASKELGDIVTMPGDRPRGGSQRGGTCVSAFPRAHWRQCGRPTRSSASIRELNRHYRVVGIFPNEAAVIRLAGGILVDIHDEWVSAKGRYFSEAYMAKLHAARDNEAATVDQLQPAD